jgi:hypothetical protein
VDISLLDYSNGTNLKTSLKAHNTNKKAKEK